MHSYGYWSRRLSAVVVAACVAALLAGAKQTEARDQAQEQAQDQAQEQAQKQVQSSSLIEIRAIALREDGSGSHIDLSTSGRLDWRAGYSDDGDLQIRFANSAPAPGLVREVVGDQLVSRLSIVAEPENEASVLRVQTRETAGYTVRVLDDGVQITLRAVADSEARSPQVATPAEPLPGAAELTHESLLSIGSGDLIEVDVLGVDELSRRVRVLSDGTITLPPMGNFLIAGLSVRQAEAKIAQLLLDQQLVNDPHVSVFVTESVGGGVSVQGAVTTPGVYQLFGRNTLIEVVGQAGGLTRDAGGRILVLREMSNGEQETIDVDVDRLVEEGDASVNITLVPGDIVVVPRGRQLKVYVTGAVRRPGAVEYSSTEGITVLQAITAAGGPTERANLKKVTLRRRLSDGTEQSIKLNVKKIQNGKENDLPLERNDTVVVGEWLL